MGTRQLYVKYDKLNILSFIVNCTVFIMFMKSCVLHVSVIIVLNTTQDGDLTDIY